MDNSKYEPKFLLGFSTSDVLLSFAPGPIDAFKKVMPFPFFYIVSSFVAGIVVHRVCNFL